MTSYAWPTAWSPQRFRMQVVPNERAFTGYYSGQTQAIDFLGEYLTVDMLLPATTSEVEGSAREAFFDRLQGRTNTITMGNLKRKVPLGTLRGAPVLASTAAQLASTITLGNCTGTNLLIGGSFELDTNADGLSDVWTAYSPGTTGAVTWTHDNSSAVDGAYCQKIAATTLGTTSADRIGVWAPVDVTGLIGQTLTVSTSVKANVTGTPLVQITVTFLDSGGSGLGTTTLYSAAAPGSWTRIVGSPIVVPASAYRMRIFLYATQRASLGATDISFDAVQCEVGTTATPFDHTSLRAGDMLGFGGQLSRVMADAVADDAGNMVVEVLPRPRTSVAGGAVVTWNYPTAIFVLDTGSAPPVDWMPGESSPITITLREA